VLTNVVWCSRIKKISWQSSPRRQLAPNLPAAPEAAPADTTALPQPPGSTGGHTSSSSPISRLHRSIRRALATHPQPPRLCIAFLINDITFLLPQAPPRRPISPIAVKWLSFPSSNSKSSARIAQSFFDFNSAHLEAKPSTPWHQDSLLDQGNGIKPFWARQHKSSKKKIEW
jgi:hypothetical protein